MSLITISGHIEDPYGQPVTSFNGTVSPIVYDKESRIKTLANDGGNIVYFGLRNNILSIKGGLAGITYPMKYSDLKISRTEIPVQMGAHYGEVGDEINVFGNSGFSMKTGEEVEKEEYDKKYGEGNWETDTFPI